MLRLVCSVLGNCKDLKQKMDPQVGDARLMNRYARTACFAAEYNENPGDLISQKSKYNQTEGASAIQGSGA